jgi:predicted nucleic acid-binding protein
VFLDAPIFLHHFLGTSRECRGLLERCERSEVRGATSALALAEVSHRLLRAEAGAGGAASPAEGDRPRRDKPEVSLKPHFHEEAVAKVPLMGVEVLALDLRVLLAAGRLRLEAGLAATSSLVAAGAREAGIEVLATTDPTLERVEGLRIYRPSDL